MATQSKRKTFVFEISAPEEFAGEAFHVDAEQLEYVRIIPKAREARFYFPRFAVTVVFGAETTRSMADKVLNEILTETSTGSVVIGMNTPNVIGVAAAVA